MPFSSKKFLKKRNLSRKQYNKIGGECNPLPGPDDIDVFTQDLLINLQPNKRVSIGRNCYDSDQLCEYVFVRGQNHTPFREPITQNQRNNLINNYCLAIPVVPVAPIAPVVAVNHQNLRKSKLNSRRLNTMRKSKNI